MIVINNKGLSADVETILKTIRSETAWKGDMYLKDIKPINNAVMVTCPFHKDHKEKKPACGVFISDSDTFKEGDFHCFTCHAMGNIVDLVAACFEETREFAKEWLVERFGNIYIKKEEFLPEITFNSPQVINTFLNESILEQYKTYHPYMWERKLSKEVVDRFNVGYDKSRNAITFPVFDEYHRLVMITARCVDSKRFYIEKEKNKPVYLLYDILNRHIQTVIAVESQINALTLRSWGYDSIGFIGTGSAHQYDILKKSGIRNYFLALDGDSAGDKGIHRFIENMPDDIMISIICIPRGKDVNDLSKEEFEALEVIDKFEWKRRTRL